MSFFSQKPELGIVYHIGTASVGAAVACFRKGDVPCVQSSLREHMPYRAEVDADRFVNDMIDALKALNVRISKNGSHGIKHVFYIFSSPWAMSETKIVSLKEDAPFSLTHAQVERIIATHEKLFETEMAGGATSNSLRSIEQRVIGIKLNGYDVIDPYGKKTKSADISFFTSLVPRSLFDKVIDLSRQTYHPRDTRAFSFALASFSVIRDIFHEESDFMFLNIGGELSDVTIVQNGLILETASFPFGRHFIIRKIKDTLGISLEEAVSMAALYETGNIEEGVREKIRPILEQAADEWTAGFHEVLGKAGGRISLPTRLFVVVNEDFTAYFMRVLESERVSEFGVTDAPLFITLVNQDNLKPAVLCAEGVERDPFTALATAFAGRVYESKER